MRGAVSISAIHPPTRTRRGRWLVWASSLVVASFVILGAPWLPRARAWTDAHVQTASASLRVEEDASLDVALVVRVQVRGGWLEGLEIAGLDPELVIDEGSVDVRSDEGERFSARASATEDGRVTITFPRRAGPRRGHHTLALRYRANLAARVAPAEDDRVRVAWTFPGWQSGLDGVAITIDAPRGARFVEEDDALVTLARERETRGDRTILRWRRAHLPRTLAWELAFEVPRGEMAPALGQEALAVTAPPDVTPIAEPPPHADAPEASLLDGLTGPALVLFLALLAMLLFAREARRRGVRPRGLVPGPTSSRIAIAIAAATASVTLLEGPAAWAALALAPLVALQRSAHASTARLGGWQPARATDFARAGRAASVRALDLVDATRPLGLVSLALLWALAARIPGVELGHVLLASVPFFVSRRRLPAAAHERLAVLVDFARGLALPDDVAVALVLHRDIHGEAQDARLRLVTAHRPRGTIRLDVVLADEDGGGGLTSVPRGLVVTRESSAAEARVADAHSGLTARRGPGGRLARLVELDALFAIAATLDTPEPDEAPTPSAARAASTASTLPAAARS